MGRLKVKHSNPKGLHDSKFYSQVVTVSGHGKTIYIGGQNAINAEGQLIGKDDLELQTKQVLKNIGTALASENATFNFFRQKSPNLKECAGCSPMSRWEVNVGWRAKDFC
ncbi:RidA family protein, partial [Calidifontibacillus erzurumensis]